MRPICCGRWSKPGGGELHENGLIEPDLADAGD